MRWTDVLRDRRRMPRPPGGEAAFTTRGKSRGSPRRLGGRGRPPLQSRKDIRGRKWVADTVVTPSVSEGPGGRAAPRANVLAPPVRAIPSETRLQLLTEVNAVVIAAH